MSLKFNKIHGSAIPEKDKFCNQNLYPNNMFNIFQKFMGGGMSQNWGAVYFFEYYIHLHGFEYVVELGSSKGGLSVYLGNYASATEQFLFHTFEINKTKDWNNRPVEGVGHWFEKLETISPYIKSYEMDVFSPEAQAIVGSNLANYRTLIICDGGNKATEFNVYAPKISSRDRIVVHDWNVEIFDYQIEQTVKTHKLRKDELFNSLEAFRTTLCPFRKE